MASQTASPASPGAQLVGNAFVDQYYNILHESPDMVYRFYQDSSVISRPEPNGVMTSATTMQGINDKILSLGYNEYKTEIKTADAQDSYKGGVIVLVTGCLTGTDNVRRKFTQTFFLAPQDKGGYFVLNDVFRYVDESELVEVNPVVANGIAETTPGTPLALDQELSPAPDHHVPDPEPSISEEDLNNEEEGCDRSDNEEGSVIEEEAVVDPSTHTNQDEVQPVAELTSTVQEDASKKSYAAIVKVMREAGGPTAVYVPTNIVRPAPATTEWQSHVPTVAPAPASVISAPSNSTPESSNIQEEAEGHSIYIRGLPLNATPHQLEEEFKKFGPIKSGGVQVRSNRHQGFCFGFVEFELLSSMQSAIEASPVMIGGRQAFVEEKRTTTRVTGSGRGRFSPGGRGSFRSNDSFRGRGSFGSRGYGRSDFGSRGEFSGRGRGPSGRSSDGYQRVDQNGNGRVGRSGGVKQTAVSA